MANITLNTKLFGTIEYDSEDGLWEYFTIELDGKAVETRLDIEAYQSEEDVIHIQNFLANIPQLIQKAKAVFTEKYPMDETIRMFVDWQMEEIDKESLLSCFTVDTLSDVTPKRFLEELKLCGISIDGNTECIMDFCLDTDITDALLVVHFGQNMEILDIAHES